MAVAVVSASRTTPRPLLPMAVSAATKERRMNAQLAGMSMLVSDDGPWPDGSGRSWWDLLFRRRDTSSKADVTSADPADSVGDVMDPRHLRELRRREQTYWWHVNKRRLVLDLLRANVPAGGRVLEVGCGGGLLQAVLAGEGWRTTAADISLAASRFAREQSGHDALVFDATEPWPVADDAFNAVLMLDVLEHLVDDARPLTEARRVIRCGGAAVITVPAHPFLFSTWDELVGHCRRYTRRRLARLADEAELRLTRLTAWNLVSLPPAAILRTKDRLLGSRQTVAEFPSVPPFLDRCLKAVGSAERTLARRLDLRMGLSLAAVLRK